MPNFALALVSDTEVEDENFSLVEAGIAYDNMNTVAMPTKFLSRRSPTGICLPAMPWSRTQISLAMNCQIEWRLIGCCKSEKEYHIVKNDQQRAPGTAAPAKRKTDSGERACGVEENRGLATSLLSQGARRRACPSDSPTKISCNGPY